MSTTDANTFVAEADPGASLAAKRVRFPKFPDIALGPLGHLADERSRLNDLTWTHFTAHRMSATCGAELQGVDITSYLSDSQINEIRDALHAYKVIFFRDQPLSAEQHVAFARRFGELELHPFIPGNDQQPELVRFEKGADTGGYENGWHHDVTWRAEPSLGAILHAVQVPPTGGDTLFCDMNAAYEGLDDETKAQIEDLDAVHDYMLAFASQVPADKQAEMREQFPTVNHPVVITHHATGKKLLYVNRFFTSHIDGLDPAAGTALLDKLCKQADTLEYQCRFRWENDSVAFWDNRAVQHYAASDYWPDVRIMERASIVGGRPSR